MRPLQDYIIEKFKISKDIETEPSFKKGDLIVRFCFYKYRSGRIIFEVGGNETKPFKFGEIKDNRFYFWSDLFNAYKDNYDYENKLFINDMGFYEAHGKTDAGTISYAIYLSESASKSLIEKLTDLFPIKEEDKGETKEILRILSKYFDTSTDLPKEFKVRTSQEKMKNFSYTDI